jgi:hypothetical protein
MRSWRKAAVGVAVLVMAVATGVAAGAAPASASPQVRVVGADGGVYWRSAADWNTPVAVAGHGVYTGDTVQLNCWVRGGTAPPYWNNPLWYDATVVSGRGTGRGLVNDHFLNTGTNQPNIVLAGVPACGSAPPPPPPAGTVINGIAVGHPTNAAHWWGSCWLRDYTGGPHGHVIVSYTGGTHVVHDGMLYGWFDNGGAPGALGCPTSDEYGFSNGVRENFARGALVWYSGWNHAQRLWGGPGTFANSAIATWMLQRAPGGVSGTVSNAYGVWLGQCRDAVNADVWAVSGHRYNLGALTAAERSNYNLGFQRVGAYRVPSVVQALPGDVVQVGNGVHTYVIVRNLGSGNLEVVDSNHGYNSRVMHYNRAFNYGGYAAISTIWRLGQV